jgi:Na+-transporting methylmalonyl-CoA/oxaloacetate decarboxylase gamma subunit
MKFIINALSKYFPYTILVFLPLYLTLFLPDIEGSNLNYFTGWGLIWTFFLSFVWFMMLMGHFEKKSNSSFEEPTRYYSERQDRKNRFVEWLNDKLERIGRTNSTEQQYNAYNHKQNKINKNHELRFTIYFSLGLGMVLSFVFFSGYVLSIKRYNDNIANELNIQEQADYKHSKESVKKDVYNTSNQKEGIFRQYSGKKFVGYREVHGNKSLTLYNFENNEPSIVLYNNDKGKVITIKEWDRNGNVTKNDTSYNSELVEFELKY